MINLVSSDEETDQGNILCKRSQEPASSNKSPLKRRSPLAKKVNNDDDDDEDEDDIEVVSQTRGKKNDIAAKKETDATTRTVPAPSSTPISRSQGRRTGGMEGVECVGERRGIQALADYPHFRFQCALEAFKRQRAQKKEQFCERCFCYVCDVPASKCTRWATHCKAVDTVSKWRTERERRLEERRRREQCRDPSQRGSVTARYTNPVRVAKVEGDSTFEGPSSEERPSSEELVGFDHTIGRFGEICLEEDVFDMRTMTQGLEASQSSAAMRAASATVDEGL